MYIGEGEDDSLCVSVVGFFVDSKIEVNGVYP